jgi:hypothetical protein
LLPLTFYETIKYDALTVDQKPLDMALKNSKNIYELYARFLGSPAFGGKIRDNGWKKEIAGIHEPLHMMRPDYQGPLLDLTEADTTEVFDFLMLAYLDSAGYAERSSRKSPEEQFQAILERYVFVVKKIQSVFAGMEYDLAKPEILKADARCLALENNSMDGVLFSPPYSFAIDYLANDSFHLNAMGEDIELLKENMVGLRGKSLKEKYRLYIADMERILSECARVLKPEKFCTIVIGTNDNQLSKALDIPKEAVTGLHRVLTDMAMHYNLKPIRNLQRQISGMSNTMRNEYIVILQKD